MTTLITAAKETHLWVAWKNLSSYTWGLMCKFYFTMNRLSDIRRSYLVKDITKAPITLVLNKIATV